MNRAIAVIPFGREYLEDRLFSRDPVLDRDNSLEPFRQLRASLLRYGFDLKTQDLISDAPAAWLHLDAHQPPPATAVMDRTVLLVLEPEVVAPYWYRKFRRSGGSPFAGCFMLSTEMAQLERIDLIRFPHDLHVYETEFDRDIDLVMISSNKMPRHRDGELYSLRRRLASDLARTESIQVYGRGWDQLSRRRPLSGIREQLRIRRVWQGPLANKQTILQRCRFTLCLENTVQEGYITEKILDSMASGAIPIYLGDPNIRRYIPAGFIDYRQLGSAEAIRKLVVRCDAEAEDNLRQAGYEFLQSSLATPFGIRAFTQRVTQAILKAAGDGT